MVFGLAAVVVGLLYLASNIFLVYDANAALYQEIADLQVSEHTLASIYIAILAYITFCFT